MNIYKSLLLAVLLTALIGSTACDAQPPASTQGSDSGSTVSTAPAFTAFTVTTQATLPPLSAQELLVSAALLDGETGDAAGDISLEIQDNQVVIKIPLTMDASLLENATVSLTAADGSVLELPAPALSEERAFELPDGRGDTLMCSLTICRQSYQLPLLEIATDDGAPIQDKDNYIHGVLTIDGVQYPMQIRGRGNASWRFFPKKSYRIKLDDGASLLGLTKNRDWVLTSAYGDKSLIRNCVAHTIAASLEGLEYTPTHIPVNLYLNGAYLGVYTFGDKIEEGKGRLDLGDPVYSGDTIEDMGFLLEIGWDFDADNVYDRDWFDAANVLRIFVKEPENDVVNSPEILYIKQYLREMETAVISNGNWEDYIDVDSWIDWFIVNELTFNTESSFYRSCYLWKPAGGKLRLGPVWDFDMAFGNHTGDLWHYNGWCTTESTYQFLPEDNWMEYLMKYPAFTNRLVERWNEVKDSLLVTALSAVDTYAAKMEGSQQQNFLVWDILHKKIGVGSVDYEIYDTYEKQVQYVYDFIVTRWNYIDTRLNSSEYSG